MWNAMLSFAEAVGTTATTLRIGTDIYAHYGIAIESDMRRLIPS